ncbi:MAG: hypothetical protein ACRD0A_07720 [Acidimicrobiales bacterium]
MVMLRRMFREQMARVEAGEDPTVSFTRAPHDRIELPCEKDKFGVDWLDFALSWVEMGSSRYSPSKDMIRKVHTDADAARGEGSRV